MANNVESKAITQDGGAVDNNAKLKPHPISVILKKTHESINNMLTLVVKSGKFTLRYETVLKLLRKSEGKLIIIRTIARPLRKSKIEYYTMLSKVGDWGFPLEGN
ncbi:hypothetical protein Vadar_013996 [Vaccinium darrowii]|uniref:Uncharacterized protein n=1 Tax=Vaccinium darrowii TaxID=229202 RepID=A0ACB7X0H0_9ERIC|nr:hypothetical protein Vadar_013996 [Vaccinium darrowii]